MSTTFVRRVARIELDDLGGGLAAAKYPLLAILWRDGVGGLLRLADGEGYVPKQSSYASKCVLCLDIRRFLWRRGFRAAELADGDFYRQLDREDG